MVRAKNYETASTFVKVVQRKLLASFFLDTVYISYITKRPVSDKVLITPAAPPITRVKAGGRGDVIVTDLFTAVE